LAAGGVKKAVTEELPRKAGARRRYPLWRRMVRWLVYGTLGLPVAAVLATFLILLTPALNRPILNASLPHIGSLLNADVAIGRLSCNIFTGKIALKDCLYAKPDADEPKPLVRAKTVKMKVNMPELIAGIIHIERLDIAGAESHLRITRDGVENLPARRPMAKAPVPRRHIPPQGDVQRPLEPAWLPLVVDLVTIEDGRFELELEGPGVTFVADDVKGTMSNDLLDAHEATANIEITQAQLTCGKLKENIRLLKVQGKISFTDFSVAASEVYLETDRLVTAFELVLDGLRKHRPSLRINAPLIKADTSIIKELFGQRLSGVVHLTDFRLSGGLWDIAFDADVWSDSLKFRGFNLKELYGHVTSRSCRMRFDPLQFKGPLGKVKTHARFNYCDESKALRALKEVPSEDL